MPRHGSTSQLLRYVVHGNETQELGRLNRFAQIQKRLRHNIEKLYPSAVKLAETTTTLLDVIDRAYANYLNAASRQQMITVKGPHEKKEVTDEVIFQESWDKLYEKVKILRKHNQAAKNLELMPESHLNCTISNIRQTTIDLSKWNSALNAYKVLSEQLSQFVSAFCFKQTIVSKYIMLAINPKDAKEIKLFVEFLTAFFEAEKGSYDVPVLPNAPQVQHPLSFFTQYNGIKIEDNNVIYAFSQIKFQKQEDLFKQQRVQLTKITNVIAKTDTATKCARKIVQAISKSAALYVEHLTTMRIGSLSTENAVQRAVERFNGFLSIEYSGANLSIKLDEEKFRAYMKANKITSKVEGLIHLVNNLLRIHLKTRKSRILLKNSLLELNSWCHRKILAVYTDKSRYQFKITANYQVLFAKDEQAVCNMHGQLMSIFFMVYQTNSLINSLPKLKMKYDVGHKVLPLIKVFEEEREKYEGRLSHLDLETQRVTEKHDLFNSHMLQLIKEVVENLNNAENVFNTVHVVEIIAGLRIEILRLFKEYGGMLQKIKNIISKDRIYHECEKFLKIDAHKKLLNKVYFMDEKQLYEVNSPAINKAFNRERQQLMNMLIGHVARLDTILEPKTFKQKAIAKFKNLKLSRYKRGFLVAYLKALRTVQCHKTMRNIVIEMSNRHKLGIEKHKKYSDKVGTLQHDLDAWIKCHSYGV